MSVAPPYLSPGRAAVDLALRAAGCDEGATGAGGDTILPDPRLVSLLLEHADETPVEGVEAADPATAHALMADLAHQCGPTVETAR